MNKMNSIYALLAVSLLLFSTSSGITASTIPETETLSESNLNIPDVPALTEDNGFHCADVNEDGFINVLDIISMVNYIMGGNPSPFNLEAADINADATINILDVIAIVNIIMQLPGMPCGCVAPVVYEEQTYTTVQIGDQCWFKENLNVGTMINSSQGGQLQTDNAIIEKYCYGNNPENCAEYGGLYEWQEAMQYVTEEGAQGICPPGWHIPKDGEFGVLVSLYGGYPNAAGDLKEAGYAHWNPPNTNATNASGFTGLPGGLRSRWVGSFTSLHEVGYQWSSTQNLSACAWTNDLWYNYPLVERACLESDFGLSIRCVKGCWPEPDQANAGPDQLNVPGTSTTMAGNTPMYGAGVWGIVSGTGGTFVDPWSPTAEFQGVAGNEYLLSWTISTDCGSTADTVVVSFAAASFTCGDPLIDERNWTSYNTVLIGSQCWIVQNLNIGEPIASNSGGQLQTDNGIIEKYCYENSPSYCSGYGGLYEWNEAMQYETIEGAQGICPAGWHIPSDGEWTILSDFLGGEYVAGGKMKSTGTIEDGTGLWYAPNEGATNESGFTGDPGGVRGYYYRDFYNVNAQGSFWSSTQSNEIKAWNRELDFGWSDVTRGNSYKDYGLSVRCLQD
ncbi:MAG TPA: FISUMP domain-containing protein [Bacteroidales bacterium]|nr:FISUMP domain-containing protein [Bacteroidales bacterium]